MRTSPNSPCFCRYRPALGAYLLNPSGVAQQRRLGALGITTGQSFQTAGAVAGSFIPIPVVGSAIGGFIGGIVGGLFGHANHAQINADVQARENAFGQYTMIAGTVPGRQLGLTAMRQIWKGAAHLGHFPLWTQHGGQEQWIDGAIDGCSGCGNTFPVLWKQAQSGAPCKNNSIACGNGTGYPVRNAADFYNYYFAPSNSPQFIGGGVPWATATDAIGRQIILDTIDAYLSQVAPASVAYIGSGGPQGSQPGSNQGGGAQTTIVPAAPITPTPLPAPVSTVQPPQGVSWVPGGPALPPYVPGAGALSPAVSGPPAAGATVAVTPQGAPITQAQFAQMVATIQAQGASQNQAMLAAIQALQSQGASVSPQLVQQTIPSGAPYPLSPAGPFAASAPGQMIDPSTGLPVVPATTPTAAGLGGGSSGIWIAAGLGLLAVLFATGRPESKAAT